MTTYAFKYEEVLLYVSVNHHALCIEVGADPFSQPVLDIAYAMASRIGEPSTFCLCDFVILVKLRDTGAPFENLAEDYLNLLLRAGFQPHEESPSNH